MTPPNKWGPVTWNLFHSLIESVTDEAFNSVYRELFNQIRSVCAVLPCPICASHANQYLSNITDAHINTQIKFRNMLYNFHNAVNMRNKKPGFLVQDLDKYKNQNIPQCFNNCVKEFNTKGNMTQISESFHRANRLKIFKKWIVENITLGRLRPN
jgi:hypothetical protein